MICIIMHHTYTCNEIFDGNHQNALFFFISGIFYKSDASLASCSKRIFRRLLIPFFSFYFIFFFWALITHFWDYRNLNDFDWSMPADLFRFHERQGCLRINVPLWFLFTLALIQAIYYYLGKTSDTTRVIISLSIIACFEPIINTPTPLLLNKAAYWIAFFTLGHVFGNRLLLILQEKGKAIKLTLSISIVWITFILLQHYSDKYTSTILQFEILISVILSISIFSFTENFSFIKQIFKFYGTNSLAIMCTHIAPLFIAMRALQKSTLPSLPL